MDNSVVIAGVGGIKALNGNGKKYNEIFFKNKKIYCHIKRPEFNTMKIITEYL